MSDDNNQPPKPNPLKTQPIKKTSAVPLRKETVRVTLKAPGAKPGAPIPPAAPTEALKPSKTPTVKLGGQAASAPGVPMPAPTIPLGSSIPKPPATAPLTPPVTAPLTAPMTQSMSPDTDVVNTKVDLPDVTSAVPLKQETMRVTLKADNKSGAPAAPAPAPTIPLGNAASAPRPAVAAPTVPLGGAATVPLATEPLKAGGSSQPLPKATVQLQQTQQLTQGLGTPSQAATIQTVSDDDVDSKRGSGAALPLSIVAFLLSLVVMYFCIQHSKIWVEKHADGEYMSIFEAPEEE